LRLAPSASGGAAGELDIKEAEEKIKAFLDDERETWIYENDEVCAKSVRNIAGEALSKMHLEYSP